MRKIRHLIVPPAEGKWSAHDNIAHLARYQPVFMERINQIISGNSPSFERYRAEDDPAFEAWRSRSLSELLDILDADRQKLADLILKLNDQQLQCTGHHPKYGTMNVLQWTEFFLLHEAHHIFTVFQIVRSVG